MDRETKLRLYLDYQLPTEINILLEECFEYDRDPEVSWAVFRAELRKLKKKHKELYLDYLELDDDVEYEKSQITKWQES